MSELILEKTTKTDATLVSHTFIDLYMPSANGEFVKIYLYLLRCFDDPVASLSISKIADVMEHTEKDILRALSYWEQVGLLTLTYNPEHTDITKISFLDLNTSTIVQPKEITAAPKMDKDPLIPQKQEYSSNRIAQLKSDETVAELLFLTQRYLGKTLSPTDVNTLLYLYDGLKLPLEVLEYLVEYCVSKGHRSMRYIEKVAMAWKENHIETIEAAKENAMLYSNRFYPILKAFGISGRNPGESEKAYMIKWTDSYGFSMDMILEACDKTLTNIHQPSFEYADTILSNWKKQGIHHLSDVQVQDKEFRQNTRTVRKAAVTPEPQTTFHNFPQRTYDISSIEKKLLEVR